MKALIPFKVTVIALMCVMGMIISFGSGMEAGKDTIMKEAFTRGYASPVKIDNEIKYEWIPQKLLSDIPPEMNK